MVSEGRATSSGRHARSGEERFGRHAGAERRLRRRRQAYCQRGQVPLSAFTHMEQTSVPITINHQGQFPVVTFSFNLAPGVSLGDAVKAIEQGEERDRHAGQHAGGVSGDGGRRSRRRSRTSRC